MVPLRQVSCAGLIAIALNESGCSVIDSLSAEARAWGKEFRPLHADASGELKNLVFSSINTMRRCGMCGASISPVHVLFIVGQADPSPEVITILCSVVEEARQRFRSKLGRAILALCGQFQPLGEAVRGILRPLPIQSVRLNGFDAIVLLDSMNTRGVALTPAEAAATHAAALANLTITDVSPCLHQLLEHGRTSLQMDGVYASLGVAEAVFSVGEMRHQISERLYRGMASTILMDSERTTVDSIVDDAWLGDVEKALLTTDINPQDATLIDVLKSSQAQSLQATFAQREYHVGRFLAFMAAREVALRRLQDRCRVRLENFMDEFAPWYVRFKLGKLPVLKAEPIINVHEHLDGMRVLLLVICLLGLLTVVGVCIYAEAFPVVAMLLVAVFALGALAILIAGLYVRTTTRIDPLLPVQRDMIRELNSFRARHELASALLDQHCSIVRSFRQEIEALRESRVGQQPPIVPDSIPIPDDVLNLLLESHQINTANALRTFWSLPEQDFTLVTGARESARDDFSQRLRLHAQAMCAAFSDIGMADLFKLMGGQAALEHPFIVTTLNRLQAESSPWMPVEGKILKTVVAIPHSVSPELREAVLDRIGRPVDCVETTRESLIVVQWTQGYTSPALNTAAGRL